MELSEHNVIFATRLLLHQGPLVADWIMGDRGNLWSRQNYGSSAATEVMVLRQKSLTLNSSAMFGFSEDFFLFRLIMGSVVAH